MRKAAGMFAAALVGLIAMTGAALACDEFKSHGNAELKEYRDKLAEAEADPLDRLFAFEEMICSDSPTIRAYAVREGLKTADDPLLRHQIMFEALMQKTRLDVELVPASNASDAEKAFIKDQAGIWSRNLPYRVRADGCISLSSARRCEPSSALIISGDKVELTDSYMIGEFRLAQDGKLVGYMLPTRVGRIPATVSLF